MVEAPHLPLYTGLIKPDNRHFEPFGAAKALFPCKAPRVLIEGPAGTGKTRGCLERLLLLMDLYPPCRLLMVRKTRASLTQTAMVTFESKVLPHPDLVPFHTGDQEYRHPNGAIMAVGGMDKGSKIMSSEYDIIYVPEATEISEDDAETLTTRLRNGVIPYQQLMMDCNPQGPLHFLNTWCNEGKCVRLKSRHRDNPEYFDQVKQTWTERGRAYLTNLKNLTGVRFWRLFKGIWRQAEGLVFEEWDANLHLVMPRVIPQRWRRIWSVDFGYRNPFVWQEWAIDDDGRMWRIQEIYRTGRLVRDHALDILKLTHGRPAPEAIVCDVDAEGRATLEDILKKKTVAAYKGSILDNVEAVKARLRRDGDGLPRILFMRDALYQRDPALEELKLPLCTEEEMEGYVWANRPTKVRADQRIKERPIDENDHGINCTQYAVGYVDKLGKLRRGAKQQSAFKGN